MEQLAERSQRVFRLEYRKFDLVIFLFGPVHRVGVRAIRPTVPAHSEGIIERFWAKLFSDPRGEMGSANSGKFEFLCRMQLGFD